MMPARVFAIAASLALFSGHTFAASPSVFDAIRNNDLAFLKAMPKSDVESRDAKGATPLMHAAAFGSLEALKILLGQGAAVNAKNDFDATALLWAAGDAAKARLLVQANADVNAASKQGRTPLMLAARGDGNSATVALLLSKGADPKVSDSQGVTALHLAAESGDLENIRLLLAKGADVNALDKKGDSPLMGAAGLGSLEAVHLLLSKGARVNVARTTYGVVKNGPIALTRLTPLIHAAPYSSPEVIKELVDAGADVNARDVREMTPLMFAVGSETQNPEVVRILLRAGAKVNARSKAEETALDWAMKFGDPAVLSLLKAAGAEPGAERVKTPHSSLEKPREPAQAVIQSVALLQRSSTDFFQASGCVGCHHQSATAIAVQAARKAGLKVDDATAREQASQLILGWGVSADDMLQGIHRGGGSDRIVTQLLAMAAAGYRPDAITDAALMDLIAMQHRDGHWFDEFEARAPISDGSIGRAANSIRVIQLFGWPGLRAEFDERVARARSFLTGAKASTGDDRAMLVLGLHWSGSSKPALDKAVHDLIAHQRPDGGWSGNDHLPSDAYATAESLIALRESGSSRPGDEPYRRGVAFLLKNQFQDGSWYVPSRAIKFQPYFQSGFPFDHDQWISTAATAMAATALASSVHQ